MRGKSLWIFLRCPTSFYNRPNDLFKAKCRSQGIFCGAGHFLRDVRVISQGELQFGVSQHFLHIARVQSVFRQYRGVGVPQIVEVAVDAQVVFYDAGDALLTVGGQPFAVGFHIDEVRDFDKLLLFRLTPVSYKVSLITGTVQLALGLVL